jgi:hypothetical protein
MGPPVGDGSRAVGFVAGLSVAKLLVLESLGSGAAGCFAGDGSVSGGESLSLTRGCGVGIGICAERGCRAEIGAGAAAGAAVGAEAVGGETWKDGFTDGTGIELWADKGAGWSEGSLECDGGAAFVSGVGGVGGAGVKGAAGTDGDWLIGGWSRPKTLAPVGIGGWNWLSAGLNGAGVKGAAGTDGDCAIEAWSRAKTLAPVGIGAWNWLSAGVGSAGVKGAAGTDSDCAIGGTSRPKMLAPVGIGAWNWLSAGTGAAAVTGVTKAEGSGETASVVAGETAVAGVGEPVAAEASAAGTDASEAGVGETGTSGGSEIAAAATGNCGGAVEGCAGTLRDECAALEAASATADGSSGDFGSASVGSGEFTDALTAPEFAGRASARTALEFEMENVAARLVAAGGTAEGTAGLPGVPEKTAVTGVTIGAGVATG